MQFSVTTTEKSGILQACERYTRLGDGTITSTASYLAQFTNYCNEVNRKVWGKIFSSYGGWQYDDGNQSDLPSSSATLKSGQTSYAIPSGALTIRGIEVKDVGGIWHALIPITEEQIRNGINNNGVQSGQIYGVNSGAIGDFQTTAGLPLYFQLVGQTAKIFPAANWEQASSFKVFYDRGSVAFLTTDTTKEPGFVSEFHDVIPLGASAIWFSLNSPEDMTLIGVRTRQGSTGGLRGSYEDRLTEIGNFYAAQSGRLFKKKLTIRQENNR